MLGRGVAAVVATLVVVVGSAGCGSSNEGDGDGASTATASSALADALPAEYRDAGKVSFVTATGNPPWASTASGSREPEGFDVDLVEALSQRLGVEADVAVVQFPAVVPGVQSGRYDAAISRLAITPERLEQLQMLGYVEIGTGLLVPAGNPAGITDLATACGKRVGVAKGSPQIAAVEDAQKDCDAQIQVVETEGNDFLALQSGRVDAMVLDAAAAEATERAQPEIFEAQTRTRYLPSVAGIAFAQDAKDLAAAYQAALEELVASGDYAELLAKWGLEDSAYEEAQMNPEVGV